MDVFCSAVCCSGVFLSIFTYQGVSFLRFLLFLFLLLFSFIRLFLIFHSFGLITASSFSSVGKIVEFLRFLLSHPLNAFPFPVNGIHVQICNRSKSHLSQETFCDLFCSVKVWWRGEIVSYQCEGWFDFLNFRRLSVYCCFKIVVACLNVLTLIC